MFAFDIPIEKVIWFFIVVLTLFCIHTLALPKKSRFPVWQALGGILVGVALFVVVSQFLLEKARLVPDSSIVAEQFYAPVFEEGSPLILLIGSSYTRHGVDPDVINAIFRENGLRARVLIRAAGGTSRLEQWQNVKEVVRNLGKVPSTVLFEVSYSYDHRPVYGLRSPYSPRALAQFDAQGTLWAVQALLKYTPESELYGMEDKASVFAGVVQHFLARTLNVGLAHNLVDLENVNTRPSFSAREEAEDDYDPVAQSDTLKPWPWEVGEVRLPSRPLNLWIKGYFSDVDKMLEQKGVETFGYYVPPSASPSKRKYSLQFCREVSPKVCINMNQRSLMDQLEADKWIDRGHLRANGAQLASVWLAQQLIDEGIAQ